MAKRQALASIALSFAVFFLSGCGDSDELAALKSDPMSTLVPSDAQIYNEVIDDRGSSPVTGKPTHARISRLMSLAETEPGQAIAEARAVAQEAGWQITESKDTAFHATRTINKIEFELTVSRFDFNGTPTLSIDLRE